ncbi:MAG: CopG family transcriptional regulator [Acidimicrobiia bacterium]
MPRNTQKSYGRTVNGVEITEDFIARAVAEAEAGYDVEMLRRRGRPTMGSGPASVLPVRLDPELRRALDERAASDETTVSAVVREALREYLRAG